MKLIIPKIKPTSDDRRVTPQSIVQRLRAGYILKKQKEAMEKAKKAGVTVAVAPGMQGIYPYPLPYPFPHEKKKEKKKKEIEGLEIPDKYGPLTKPSRTEEEKKFLETLNVYYHLIPRFPKKGEFIYAYANIKWDKTKGELIYRVIEPQITKEDEKIIKKVKEDLEERLDIDLTKLGTVKAKELLRNEILKSLSEMPDLVLNENRKTALVYYIERDTIGLGKIDALMNDANIEDISCDGVGINIYVYHRDPRLGSLKTNVIFEDKDELNTFVIKIAQKCNKTISITKPLLDASLPDGSRVQATLGTDIARKGSNFTIRRFTEKPLTPTHMLRYNTLNSTQLAYLWLAIENRKSVLISGGTATGKTSLLNALSLFIRPTMKIVSIEDTAELVLPHPHWIPEVARTPLSLKGTLGEVTLFDLLKSSLRQRPDYIVLGEVRGKEAFVLFQQMATGHPSLATIHAASLPQLIDRLITPPISLPPSLIENIDIIVFLVLSKIKESYVRRANNILEVVGLEKDRPKTKNVFKWVPIGDKFDISEKSVVLKKISERLGISETSIQQELARRKRILEWMLEQEIFDYKEFAKVVSTYYTNPDRIIELITEGTAEEGV